MPSSHAQFVAFFSISLSLFLLFRHAPTPSVTHTPIPLWQRAGLSVVACLGASAVALSRIYLNYHTPKQVLVGCAAGAVTALLWFTLTSILRYYGWIEWALDTELAEMLRFRDLIMTEDLVDAGWGRWMDRKRLRKRDMDTNGIAKTKRP